jgi:CHAT domain-containing protein
MEAFYRAYMQSGNMATSLQSAMKQLREQNPHPYFWAPFVLVGQLSVNKRLN